MVEVKWMDEDENYFVEAMDNEAFNNNSDVTFLGNSYSRNTDTKDAAHSSNGSTFSTQNNSCKILQRKLELKVERARKNFRSQTDSDIEIEVKPNLSSMIPINRLAIPKQKENVPLVEYKSDHSSDDDDTSTFFPQQMKMKKVDLSDTFSLQEMTIDSDGSDSDSQTLEFLPPNGRSKFLDKLVYFFCCLASDS